MQEIEPDEHQLQIERGGTISLTVAQSQEKLRQQLLMATNHQWGGDEATSLQSWLTSYDPMGDYIFGNQMEAQFTATRQQEAHEVRYKTWLGRGTVRTLRGHLDGDYPIHTGPAGRVRLDHG